MDCIYFRRFSQCSTEEISEQSIVPGGPNQSAVLSSETVNRVSVVSPFGFLSLSPAELPTSIQLPRVFCFSYCIMLSGLGDNHVILAVENSATLMNTIVSVGFSSKLACSLDSSDTMT